MKLQKFQKKICKRHHFPVFPPKRQKQVDFPDFPHVMATQFLLRVECFFSCLVHDWGLT